MKKVFSIQLFIMFYVLSGLAQLYVLENGNVGIDVPNPTKPLEVRTSNSMVGLEVYRMGNIPSNFQGMPVQSAISAYSSLSPGASYSAGLSGSASANSVQNGGGVIGVHGYAGYAKSGYNYGMLGQLYYNGANRFGAGICGATQYNGDIIPYIDGVYAGYFVGDVKVRGTLFANNIPNSDRRMKQDIKPLVEQSTNRNSLNTRATESALWTKLQQLNPVQYHFKQIYLDPDKNKSPKERAYFDEESQFFQKQHFGLIAQELQEVYPELVYEEDNGYLGINYTELIPLLLQAVQDLKAELDELKGNDGAAVISLKQGTATLETSSFIETTESKVASLEQNIPNPFNQNTAIRYYLPETVSTAQLCIYDLNGKQLKQITLSGRGEGSQIISGSEFSAGIYLYALIADGQEVDVKRMILTE